MIPIQPFGSYLELDARGHVIPLASPHRIQGPWRPLIDEVTALYRRLAGQQLRAVYVRGSVAKGQAVDHLSDLDTLCVVKSETTLDESACEAFRHAARGAYPFCVSIELVCVTEEAIMSFISRARFGVWTRIIKTQAVCVWGDDIADRIPPLTLDDMVHYSRFMRCNMESKLPVFIEEDKENAEDLAALCSWTARILLRAGYELVMHREGRWTNDLYLCYEALSRHYPERAEMAYQILEHAINPRPDVATILAMVDGYTPWIYDAFQLTLGHASDEHY